MKIREIKADFDKAKRAEQRAQAELVRSEQLTESQKSQLDTLLKHREECLEGLRDAKSSGLNIIQIREYQLLLKHLEGVLHEQQEKIDICQVREEESRDDWVQKSERLERLQLMMQQVEQDLRDEREREINGQAEPADKKHTDTYIGVTGKRLG